MLLSLTDIISRELTTIGWIQYPYQKLFFLPTFYLLFLQRNLQQKSFWWQVFDLRLTLEPGIQIAVIYTFLSFNLLFSHGVEFTAVLLAWCCPIRITPGTCYYCTVCLVWFCGLLSISADTRATVTPVHAQRTGLSRSIPSRRRSG